MVKLTNSNILSVFRKQMGISKAEETAFVEAFQSIFEEALLRDKTLKISGLLPSTIAETSTLSA